MKNISVILTAAVSMFIVGYGSQEGNIETPIPPTFIVAPPTTTTPTSNTSTLLPSYTPIEPSVTLSPTLTGDERESYITDLLATNAGCELPCWGFGAWRDEMGTGFRILRSSWD